MRFLLASDIHNEFKDLPFDAPCPTDIDAVLIAGDIWTKGRSIATLEKIAAWAGVPVVATAGNHDYYGESMWKIDQRLPEKAAISEYDIRYLNPGVTQIGDTRIIAATLWTDYRLRCSSGPNWAERNACDNIMNDHKKIRWGYGAFRPVTPDDLASVHLKHKTFITEELSRPFDGVTLVMTHHAPHERSVSYKRPAIIDHAYASNLEDMILEYAPNAWLHGHTHHPEDYMIGNTQIISNPRGYPDEGIDFDMTRVFDTAEFRKTAEIDAAM